MLLEAIAAHLVALLCVLGRDLLLAAYGTPTQISIPWDQMSSWVQPIPLNKFCLGGGLRSSIVLPEGQPGTVNPHLPCGLTHEQISDAMKVPLFV